MTIEYIGFAAEYYIKVVGKHAVATYSHTDSALGHSSVNYYEIHKEIPSVSEIEENRKPNRALIKELTEYFKDRAMFFND
jgi:hypothetical protein